MTLLRFCAFRRCQENMIPARLLLLLLYFLIVPLALARGADTLCARAYDGESSQ